MAIVGAAEVPVRPTFPGFQRTVDKEISGVGAQFEGKKGRSLGGRLMSGIGTGLKWGALAVGTATAGILTTALVKGWQRLTAIENAEASLKGLGHSAKSVQGIMDNALNSVLGTAFGLDEAATVAASAVAAGVKPGKDLEGVLRLTADAATIAGTGMDEMGAIFNKVASSNKVQGDVIAQLHERGIPIIQMLSKEMGTSVEETYKLASAGKINFETFRAAMEDGVGGAALTAGDTTQGAFANMMAALSRFGAQLLVGVFPLAKTVFGGITSLIDDLTMKAEPLVTAFSENLTGGLRAFAFAWESFNGDVTSVGFAGFMERLAYRTRVAFETIRGGLRAFAFSWESFNGDVTSVGFAGFMERLAYRTRVAFETVMDWVSRFREGWQESASTVESSGVVGFFERFAEASSGAGGAANTASNILSGLGQVFAGIADVLPGLIRSGLDIVGGLIGWIGDNMHMIAPLLPVIAAGFVAWKLATMGLSFSMARLQMAQTVMAPVFLASNLARITAVRMERSLAIATGQTTAATTAKTAATAGATGAQRGLNAAMRANPIMAVLSVLTLLVGGLIWFFTQTETGQGIWSSFTSALADGWSWTVDAVVGLWENTLRPALQAVGDVAVSVWESTIRPAWEGLKAGWDAAVAGVKWAWESLLQPTFQAVASVVTWLYDSIIKPYFDFVAAAWRVVGSVFSWVWSGIIQPVFTLAGDIIKWLWVSVAMPMFASIGTGFRALGGVFTGIWTSVIRPVFTFIGDIISWLWRNIAQPYFQHVGAAFSLMGNLLRNVWTNTVRPMISAFGDWVTRLYRNYIQPALGWISDRWSWLAGGISDFWNDRIKPVLRAFGTFIKEDVPGMVRDGVDMIDKAWRTVANFFRTPINWVINTVWNDGIKAAFDNVAKAVNSPARLDDIPTIPRFAKGGYHKGGWALVGEEGPELIDTRTPVRVYTTNQTSAALAGAPSGLAIGGGDDEGNWFTRSAKWVGGKISDGAEWVGGRAAAALDWARGKLADTAEKFLQPLLDSVGEWAGDFGSMGQLGSGLIDWGTKQVLDWIRGKDDEAAAEGVYDGAFTKNPGGFNRPAAGVITSRAGRRAYAGRFGGMHYGVDIANSIGTTIRAAYDGIVKRIYGGGMDKRMVLGHKGFDTSYLHNSAHVVGLGDTVSGGQPIGRMGTAGTGPHLHFEVHPGAWYNPSIPRVNALVRDEGGLLYPGMNHVLNKTGKAEYSFNERDFREVRSIIRGDGGGRGRHAEVLNFYGVNHDQARANHQEANRRRKMAALSGARG